MGDLWSLGLLGRAMGPPLPLFKVYYVLGLRCKLSSWEFWERSEVRIFAPPILCRKTHGQEGSLLDPNCSST